MQGCGSLICALSMVAIRAVKYRPFAKSTKETRYTLMTMKWHKFLVNFGLWLNAALILMLAVTAFSGAQYGNEAE